MTGVLAVAALTFGSTQAEPPSYGREVRPFLDRYCRDCHREKRAKANVRLDTFESLLSGQKPVVVPGEPDTSPLLRVMTGRGRTMPPRGWDQPTAAELTAISDWVKAGAKYATSESKPPKWAVKTSFRLSAAATALAVGPKFIAAGTAAGGVTIWDTRTFRELGTLDPEKAGGRVSILSLADGGKTLVSVHGPNIVRRWAGEGFAPAAPMGGVRLVGLTPDGSAWLATPMDNPVRLGLYPIKAGRESAAPTFTADAGGPITWAAATPNGRQILAADRVPSEEPDDPTEARIVCWIRDGDLFWIARQQLETNGPSVAAVAPDASYAAFAGPTGPVLLIDMTTGKFVLKYAPHDPALMVPTVQAASLPPAPVAPPRRSVRALAFRPDSKQLASGGDDGTVRVWDCANPAELAGRYLMPGVPSDGVPPLAVLREHSAPVTAVAFGPDGKTLVSAASNGRVIVWVPRE